MYSVFAYRLVYGLYYKRELIQYLLSFYFQEHAMLNFQYVKQPPNLTLKSSRC